MFQAKSRLRSACSPEALMAKSALGLYLTLFATGMLGIRAFAQSAPTSTRPNDLTPRVALKELSPLTYPALAYTAGITGDVSLNITVHADGSVASVTTVSGPALLLSAAADSARKSRFECQNCGRADRSQSFTYSFRLSPEKADPCCCSSGSTWNKTASNLQVIESENHVILTRSPVCICPDDCSVRSAYAHARFRSAKCLYLWKCGQGNIFVY